MTAPPTTADLASRPAPDRDLVVLFSKALRQLGDAGHPAAANRLAANAWWALKDDDPKGAQRISGVMHYLAKLPEEAVDLSRRSTEPTSTEPTRHGVN